MLRGTKSLTSYFQYKPGNPQGSFIINSLLLAGLILSLLLWPAVTQADRLPGAGSEQEIQAVAKQALPPKLGLAIDYTASTTIPADAQKMLTEINPQGLRLGRDGRLTGRMVQSPADIQATGLAVIPTIRNWTGAEALTANPVNELLTDPVMGEHHLEAIIDLVEQNEYDGIDLDYREIDPTLRQEYILFLIRLRQALPGDKLLSVRLELPHQLSTGTWDTGAYDWPAIGRLADRVKLPTWPDPQAYVSGGQMETMLDWAVDQIDHQKLQLLIRPNSTQRIDTVVRDLTTEQALEQVGQVTVIGQTDLFDPGQTIDFTLSGLPASTGVRVDAQTNTYWFAYLDEENRHHTIYLENPASLVEPLQLATDRNLGGVAIQVLSGQKVNGEIWDVIRSFSDSTGPAVENQYTVRWRISEAGERPVAEATVDLSEPTYRWTAPESGGLFEVAADILSSQNSSPVSGGQVAVRVATPAPTPAPKPQPAPAQTRNQPPPPAVPPVDVPFGYGLQADPRGDTGANVGHIQALGFSWVKIQMPWKDVESSGPGQYNWGMWDQLVNAYHANGIQILLSIPKAPDWARPIDDDKSVEGPPEDPAKYAQFVGNVAGRYRGKVQAIEVWNEQNLWYEAGGLGRINAANYVELLQLSYRAIKEANPEMIVVSGALTPAGNVGGAAVDDIEYLKQMYANGAKGFFDALGAHPSGYNCPATGDWRTVQDSTAVNFRGTFDNRHHSWCFRGTMEGYREVMVANGDGDKVIVPTEFGWAVSNQPKPGYEYAQDNTPEEQAQWIVEAYQMAKSWGWVGPMFLWNLDYGVTAPGTELAAFGIIDTPAYHALANMPK